MELVGQGGVWKIYKLENQNCVFRIPKGSSKASINKFLANFELIKDLGLPTLKTVEEYEINGTTGIICDNVNCFDEKIYVTYNSLYSDSNKYLYSLYKDFFANQKERESSLAEDFRYKNKVEDLTNFDEFLINIKSDLQLATKQDILIEFDSYFFGTQKRTAISKIDYKLVDLDHIFTQTNMTEVELYERNISEFCRAINGFLKYFVSDKNRSKYLDILM